MLKKLRIYTCMVLYLVTLHYILPFRPISMYYYSKNPTHRTYKLSPELIAQRYGSEDQPFLKANFAKFPKKPKVRFSLGLYKLEEPHVSIELYTEVEIVQHFVDESPIVSAINFTADRAPPVC